MRGLGLAAAAVAMLGLAGCDLPDRDGDGIPDHLEVLGGWDPADPDSDGDGTGDGATDSDSDGWSDWVELALGRDPHDPGSSPEVDMDHDHDGLTSWHEQQIGTSPFDRDTDDDGRSDSQEVDAGTDPLDRTVPPPPTNTLTFDEHDVVHLAPPVIGMEVEGVRIRYVDIPEEPTWHFTYGLDVWVPASLIWPPFLSGDARGAVWFEFEDPTTIVELGVMVGPLDPGARTDAVHVDLYNRDTHLGRLGVHTESGDATAPSLAQGRFGYQGPAVTAVLVSFTEEDFTTDHLFGIDNLTYQVPYDPEP